MTPVSEGYGGSSATVDRGGDAATVVDGVTAAADGRSADTCRSPGSGRPGKSDFGNGGRISRVANGDSGYQQGLSAQDLGGAVSASSGTRE